ncbi:MAG: hypothetical protein FWF15_11360 [Oscillospiraceae bacterium]|nr:hypothetical protein [Oscillospiraceae bacterium]
MSAYFNITLDTTPPQDVTLKINGGAAYTAGQTVTLTIGTADPVTTGYQMLIWGIDGAASEGGASWETLNTLKTVTLPYGDGLKTVYVKLRDDVHNASAAVSASITLNSAVPVITVSGPDVAKISKVTGKDVSTISFMSDEPFVEYMVRAVPNENSLHTAGVLIPTDGGSTNTSGDGEFAADTAIQCTITGADLDAADSGDGVKGLKVFVKTVAGIWSV